MCVPRENKGEIPHNLLSCYNGHQMKGMKDKIATQAKVCIDRKKERKKILNTELCIAWQRLDFDCK